MMLGAWSDSLACLHKVYQSDMHKRNAAKNLNRPLMMHTKAACSGAMSAARRPNAFKLNRDNSNGIHFVPDWSPARERRNWITFKSNYNGF